MEKIRISYVVVPISTDKVFTMIQAFQTFLVWPKQLDGLISYLPARAYLWYTFLFMYV